MDTNDLEGILEYEYYSSSSDIEYRQYSASLDDNLETEYKTGFWGKIKNGMKSMLDWYFKPKAIERWNDGLIYKPLGVTIFKKIVPTSGSLWNKHIFKYRPIADAEDKNEALEEWEPWTRTYEGMHILGAIGLGILNSFNYIEGEFATGAKMSVLNVLINAYPIMLQRYNRARIYNALEW